LELEFKHFDIYTCLYTYKHKIQKHYAFRQKKGIEIHLKIFLSENILPNQTELGWNGPWMFLFKNYDQQPYPTSKMAVVTTDVKVGGTVRHSY
jgi:hypothetical protein